MASAAPVVYTAPIMEVCDLVDLAKQMLPDIRLTEADIKTPRSFHLMYIYEAVLRDIGVNVDSVRQTHWQALPTEYAEGFEDALPLVRFGKFMVNFMKKIGEPDFQFRDVINPKPKRTRRMLSSLFNFWHFVCSQGDKIEDIKKKAFDAKEEELKLQSGIESYKRQINEIKKKTIEEEPVRLQIEAEIEAKRTEMEELTRETKQLKEKFASIKLHGSEVASSNADLVLKIQKAKQENAALESQIVHSPDRIKEEVVQERQRLDLLVENKHQLQLRMQELVEHREHLKSRMATVGTFNENMGHIAEHLQKEREVDASLKERRSRTQRLHRELSDAQVNLSDLSTMKSTKQERLSTFEMQHAAKMNALQQKLKVAQSDAEMVEQLQNERDIVLMDIEQEQERIEKEIEAVNRKADENVAHINAQFHTLLSKVDEFNKMIIPEVMAASDWMSAGLKADEEKLKRLEDLDIFADNLVL